MLVRFVKSRMSTELSGYWFAVYARKPSVGLTQPTANIYGLRQSSLATKAHKPLITNGLRGPARVSR